MGGFLGGLFGTPGSSAQVVTTTPYDQMSQGGQSGNFNDLANTNSTYLADMFSQLGTGQAPSYYQKYQAQAQPYQQNMNNQNFFGTAGNRSQNMYGAPTAFGNAMSQSAIQGLNPKAMTQRLGQVGQQWQNQSNAIDQYFAGQGLNTINATAQGLPGWATGQQNSLTDAFRPTQSVIPAQAGTPSPLFGLAGAMGLSGFFNGMGSNMMNGLGGLFGGGAAAGAGAGAGLSGFGGTLGAGGLLGGTGAAGSALGASSMLAL